MRNALIFAVFFWSLISALPAKADTICTLVADAQTGAVLLEEGDCGARVTPASTFKVPLAVMGYDAGILVDESRPVMAYRANDPDWGGANWTRDTDPVNWLRYSVLWYSQRITHVMGQSALTQYARDFHYGNADFSGDPGFDNGLERAWIASSLLVSPREQVAFLRALVNDALPVSPEAMRTTRAIMEDREVGDWTLFGKTGAAYPRRADRSFDYARGWGWFVGWARNGDRTLVFARLTQAQERTDGSPGNLTRDALLLEWADLVN
ncbi:MAG: class D beta-lactamase [Maritimibacter sp.]